MKFNACRIQFAVGNRLVAEVIVEDYFEAMRVAARYAQLKYDRKKPIGAISHTSVARRPWNVKVGEEIHQPQFLTVNEFIQRWN